MLFKRLLDITWVTLIISTLYPTDDVLETMLKDVLQLTSEKVPEFPLLFKGHLSYIRHDIANKQGKYSTDIRRTFFSTSGIKRPHKHMTDTEKDEFIRSCKELRELQMEIEGGKIIYKWHRETGVEAFNSDLLVVVLGLTFADSKNHCSIKGCKLEQRVPRKRERLHIQIHIHIHIILENRKLKFYSFDMF